jgi:DUF2934 family protein
LSAVPEVSINFWTDFLVASRMATDRTVDFSERAKKDVTPAPQNASNRGIFRVPMWPVSCSLAKRKSRAPPKGILMPRPSKTQSTTPAGPRLVKAAPSSKGVQPEVSFEQIAIRAFELFAQEGYMHGHDVDHWLRAERELKDVTPVARPRRVAGTRAQS